MPGLSLFPFCQKQEKRNIDIFLFFFALFKFFIDCWCDKSIYTLFACCISDPLFIWFWEKYPGEPVGFCVPSVVRSCFRFGLAHAITPFVFGIISCFPGSWERLSLPFSLFNVLFCYDSGMVLDVGVIVCYCLPAFRSGIFFAANLNIFPSI